MSTPRSRSVLAAAARLYYVDGLSQAEAAAKLGMTRSNLSRVLTAAREQGVIEFRVHDEADRDFESEAELVAAFDLRGARVISSPADRPALPAVAQCAARMLEEALVGARVVAVSWGATVRAVVEALTETTSPDLRVVQLVGGLTSFEPHVSAHDLVRELGRRLGASYLYLNAPGVFDSIEALNVLSAEQSISSTLELARQADVALVGIGNPAHGSSQALLRQLASGSGELAKFWSAGPVGDVCGRYYDAIGQPLEIPGISDRVLAIDIPALRQVPVSIGVAVGRAKSGAVLGALRGGLINTLVCDEALARELFAHPGSGAADSRP
jgi:DNA-binding transcriptional regulator LsrR (DeoR family)